MHAEEEGLVLNPDSEILEKVIKGMVKIKRKKKESFIAHADWLLGIRKLMTK